MVIYKNANLILNRRRLFSPLSILAKYENAQMYVPS